METVGYFQAIECGQSDTYDSTILWVPDLRVAVCGDVVYGQVHQMLLEANTKFNRQAWIRSIEKAENLDPVYVVAGHKQAEEMDGVWHLAAPKKYIQDFGKVLEEKDPKDANELAAEMLKLYPDRYNLFALQLSAIGAFLVPKEQHIHIECTVPNMNYELRFGTRGFVGCELGVDVVGYEGWTRVLYPTSCKSIL